MGPVSTAHVRNPSPEEPLEGFFRAYHEEMLGRLSLDDTINVYKKHIDRTLPRKRLFKAHDQRHRATVKLKTVGGPS